MVTTEAALKAFVDPWSMGGADWQSRLTYDTFSRAVAAIAKAQPPAVSN